MKIKEVDSAIRKLVSANDGFCPCAIEKTEETKCPCLEFRESKTGTICHCGRFVMESGDRDNDEKLAKYEATGLTPEQVLFLKEITNGIFGGNTTLVERHRELIKADHEDRLILLPVREGTPYFSIQCFCTEYGYFPTPEEHHLWEFCEGCDVERCDKTYRVVEHCFISKDEVYEKRKRIGKSIWLTREEAEAKCKKMEENK